MHLIALSSFWGELYNSRHYKPGYVVKRIDKLAEKGDITRSKLLANMVEVGIDDYFLRSL
jgi:DNA-binding MarR family transcriptional regulator